MDELSDHLGGGNATSGTSNYHHLSASSVSAAASSPPPLTASYGRNSFYLHHLPPPLNSGAAQRVVEEEHGEICAGDEDIQELKAKIMAHPHYSRLATAYLDCQKVGAPPDMEANLSAVARAIESRSGCRLEPNSFEPELDLFMEAYCDLMMKYREELTRLFQDATDFIKGAESQFNSLIDAPCSLPLFSSAGKLVESLIYTSSADSKKGHASPEEEPDASCGETDVSEIDPIAASDKELKLHLLKKYSGYLGSLRQQLSKTKKKGKLPKEARQKLLSWWELHYRWPYPSESEKLALAESTGLDQKQINNWFINQRKRHWKPTEEAQFIMADGFHPQSDANILVQGRQYMGDGLYRIAPP